MPHEQSCTVISMPSSHRSSNSTILPSVASRYLWEGSRHAESLQLRGAFAATEPPMRPLMWRVAAQLAAHSRVLKLVQARDPSTPLPPSNLPRLR